MGTKRQAGARLAPAAATVEQALALHRQGRLAEAGQIYDAILSANPADFDYAFNLGYGAAWFADDPLLRTLRRLLDAETARHIER